MNNFLQTISSKIMRLKMREQLIEKGNQPERRHGNGYMSYREQSLSLWHSTLFSILCSGCGCFLSFPASPKIGLAHVVKLPRKLPVVAANLTSLLLLGCLTDVMMTSSYTFFDDLVHKNTHIWWGFSDWPDKNDEMDLQQTSMKDTIHDDIR